MDLLAKNSSTWKLISKELQEQDAIGEQLNLCCQTHGNISKVKFIRKKIEWKDDWYTKITSSIRYDSHPISIKLNLVDVVQRAVLN